MKTIKINKNPIMDTVKNSTINTGKISPTTNIFSGTKSVLTYEKNNNNHMANWTLNKNLNGTSRDGSNNFKPRTLNGEILDLNNQYKGYAPSKKLVESENFEELSNLSENQKLEETVYRHNMINYKQGVGGSSKVSAVPKQQIAQASKALAPMQHRQNLNGIIGDMSAMKKHQGLNFLRKNNTQVRQAIMSQSQPTQ